MEIANRIVVITGANRGIGRAFARTCAEDQAHLHLVLRNKDNELESLLIKEGAKSVTTHIADLGQAKQVLQLVEELKLTSVDILFNNAGVMTGGYLEEQNLATITEMLQVNVTSMIQLTQGLLPGMIERKRGKIINSSSIMAYVHLPFVSTYAAASAAVSGFTQSLEQELKETGVQTLLLVTPAVRTRMLENMEDLFTKAMRVPLSSLSPQQYAMMIRDAIIHDLKILEPSGVMGVALKVAKFASPLLGKEVQRRFQRHSKGRLSN